MKVVFIEAPYDWHDRDTVKVRNYGLERLAGHIVSKGFLSSDMGYCDFTFSSTFNLSEIPSVPVYAFSVMQPNYESSLKLAAELKERDKDCIIVFGGPSVADLKTEILEVNPQVDYALFGFCEESFFELLTGSVVGKIPNLFYRKKDKVIFNGIKYPQDGWQKVMPYRLENIIGGKYKDDHNIVLAALGCGYACNFCNIIKAQPELYERDTEKIIDEIKRIGGCDYSLQFMHQNLVSRLPDIVSGLDLSKIKSIAFNSRADTFLSDVEVFEKVLSDYPDTFFIIYIGFENFDGRELKRLNKGISAKENIDACRRLISLEKEYDNLDYVMTFIGFNSMTKMEEIRENISVFKELFFDTGSVRNVFRFFSSPLRIGVEKALRKGLRERGHYPQEYFELPQDEEVLRFYEDYIRLVEGFPSFEDRRDDYYEYILETGRESEKLKERVWAELYIAEMLAFGKKKEAESFSETIK